MWLKIRTLTLFALVAFFLSQHAFPQSQTGRGYYYFKSSRTGQVTLALVNYPEEKYGGGRVLTGVDGIYTYIGRVNDRDKWTTFTINLLRDAHVNPYTGQTFYVMNGKSERIPNNEKVIFTAPDMSAVYTVSDNFDRRITREEWVKADNQGRSFSYGSAGSSSSSSTSAPVYQNNKTERQRYNNSGYAQCRHCSGTGRCSTCNGTGDRGDTHNREPNKVVWKCTTCSGSGRCMFCRGLGKIRN